MLRGGERDFFLGRLDTTCLRLPLLFLERLNFKSLDGRARGGETGLSSPPVRGGPISRIGDQGGLGVTPRKGLSMRLNMRLRW
jgi:hypothetical protein